MEIITILIAVFSLIMAYVGFKDKKSDKTDKELADRIKATVLSDAVTVKADALSNAVNAKAAVLSDAVNIKSMEIKKLQKQTNDIELKLEVTIERVSSLREVVHKIDDKLELILEKLNS